MTNLTHIQSFAISNESALTDLSSRPIPRLDTKEKSWVLNITEKTASNSASENNTIWPGFLFYTCLPSQDTNGCLEAVTFQILQILTATLHEFTNIVLSCFSYPNCKKKYFPYLQWAM